MAKNKTKEPRSRAPAPKAASRNPFALNAEFNRQTRKVLGKHYRAKFGVK